MPDIALYYPYSHVRDETWLKAAALYLPKLALVAPRDYPLRLSRTARSLRDELGFLVQVDPSQRAHAVAAEFVELINRESAALQSRYGWPRQFPADLYAAVGTDGCHPGQMFDGVVEWVHVGKLRPALIDHLVETRLGVLNDDQSWIAMHPRLGSVYLAALADRVARANGMPVVTDQPSAHGVLNGWQLGTLARVLLDDDDDNGDDPPRRQPAEVAALYAALAIDAVVPDRLAEVPVARIVKARRVLAAEFDAFCSHLDSLSEQFSELARVEDPAILNARLEVLVGRDLRRPTAELERGLRRLGLQPARAVLGMKSLELPVVASAAASGAGLPVVAGQAGMAAAQFVASSVRAQYAAAERRRSAAGYLLGVRKQLTTVSVVDRIRRMFQRAAADTMATPASGERLERPGREF